MVPTQSVIVDNDGKSYVYALDKTGKIAVKKFIKTGKLLSEGIEISSGLKKGELIVVTGQQKLSNFSIVKVIEE